MVIDSYSTVWDSTFYHPRWDTMSFRSNDTHQRRFGMVFWVRRFHSAWKDVLPIGVLE